MGVKARIASAWGKLFGKPEKFDAQIVESGQMDRFDIPAKLMDRVRKAYQDMEPFRQSRRDSVKQFLGKYGRQGSEEREVIIPLMRYMVQIYMRLLASGTPQAAITTDYEHLEAYAANMEAVFNRHLREIELGNALESAVFDAMFSVGVVKTGLAEGDEEDHFEIDGEIYDIGRAFSSSVTLDNFVIDMQADSRFEIDFMGDRFLRPRAWVMKMAERRNENSRKDAGIDSASQSYMPPQERVSGIDEGGENRLYDMVWCWNIYLPKQGVCCYFADNDDVPLDARPFKGPERGPYRLIGFDWVAGEVLPAPPAVALEPLHMLVNSLARKLGRQASRQKTIYAYPKGQEKDAEAVRTANDGMVIGLTQVDRDVPRQLTFDGPNPSLHNLSIWAIQEFDKFGGSLGVLAGSEPMSETVGQDQLLHQSANALVNKMRKEIRRAMKGVLAQHAWYLWTDPLREYSGERKIPGTSDSIDINMTFDEEVREGDFLQYNFDIRPYSLQEMTPGEEAQTLRDYWVNDVIPNLEIIMQSGKMPNVVAYLEKEAELRGLSADDLLVDMNPQQGGEEEGGGGAIPLPSQFKRSETVNTRVSRPGTTRGAQNNEVVKALGQMASAQGQS